jgi:hypothetical protein
MNDLEQRLTDALRARTDLVTLDRLTPAAPPAAVVRPRWRRSAAYALAAAACAAAIATPFVLLQGNGDDSGPVVTPSPTPTVTSGTDAGADWPVAERREETDVTGDGDPDELVLRREPAPGHRARVEVTGLADGWVVLEGRPEAMAFAASTGLDDVPGDEITLRHTKPASGFPALDVLTVRDGRLVHAVPEARDAALSSPVQDGQAWGWWFEPDGEADGLFSARAEPSGDPADADATWRWRVSADGTRLVATKVPPEGRQGTDEGFETGSSPFADRADEVIGIDEEFFTNLDGGGDDSVRLFTPGDVARLEVTFDDGTSTHLDIDPPQAAIDSGDLLPTVHTTYLAARTPMLVVRWGGPEGVTQVIDPAGHELRPLAFTSSFGSNTDEEGGTIHSVLTEDGSFYAVRQVSDESVDVYRWEVAYDGDQAAYLALGNSGRPIGRWCPDSGSGRWVTCR